MDDMQAVMAGNFEESVRKYLEWFFEQSMVRKTQMWSVNIYDLLALCHLMPSHSQHEWRPYLQSHTDFKVFNRKPYEDETDDTIQQ